MQSITKSLDMLQHPADWLTGLAIGAAGDYRDGTEFNPFPITDRNK
jgi:hypothetical protein